MFFLNNHGEHGAVLHERGTEDTENRCVLRVLRAAPVIAFVASISKRDIFVVEPGLGVASTPPLSVIEAVGTCDWCLEQFTGDESGGIIFRGVHF